MKLIPGRNFSNNLWAAFKSTDTKSTKRHRWLDWLFVFLRFAGIKAFRKHVGEIDPRSQKKIRCNSEISRLTTPITEDNRIIESTVCHESKNITFLEDREWERARQVTARYIEDLCQLWLGPTPWRAATASTTTLATPSRAGFNFNNILHAAFSYESVCTAFSLVTVWLCNFLVPKYWHKSCSKNVDEIDHWS